jgi:hypothetical protein
MIKNKSDQKYKQKIIKNYIKKKEERNKEI